MRLGEIDSDRLDCQREAFDLPRDAHYLNCAYMGPLPRLSAEAGVQGVLRKLTPAVISATDFFSGSDEVRALFARLIGAPDPARVALLPSASYGIAICARNALAKRGQNVVLTHEQFPGNVYAWRRLGLEKGLDLRLVAPPTGAHRGAAWNERILEAIDRDTAVVSLGHVHWTDGTLFDLAAIGERARSVGAMLVVDATQSVGALPFDVEVLRPDAVVCAAYKWLLGPYSVTLGWFGPRFDGGVPLEETWIGRKGSENFGGLVDYVDEYHEGALRYDVGERSNFILLPILAESLRLLLGWTPAGIQEYIADLTSDLIEGAVADGYAVEEAAWRAGHLFGLRTPPGLERERLSVELQRRAVQVSERGTAIRVSPHLYNDADDVGRLAEALRAAVT